MCNMPLTASRSAVLTCLDGVRDNGYVWADRIFDQIVPVMDYRTSIQPLSQDSYIYLRLPGSYACLLYSGRHCQDPDL